MQVPDGLLPERQVERMRVDRAGEPSVIKGSVSAKNPYR